MASELEVRNLGTRGASKLRSLLGFWKGAQRAVLRLTFGAWSQRGLAVLSDVGLPDLRNSSQSELDALAAETHAMLKIIPDSKALTNPFGTLMEAATHISQRNSARKPKDFSRPVDDDDSVGQPSCTLSSEQHKILLLRVNERSTYQQIAEKLEISPRHALAQLSRAYSAMRCGSV